MSMQQQKNLKTSIKSTSVTMECLKGQALFTLFRSLVESEQYGGQSHPSYSHPRNIMIQQKLMGKYQRAQCIHIYQRTHGEMKKGERCLRKGRLDEDGNFRCWLHRVKRFSYSLEKNQRNRLKTLERWKAKVEGYESAKQKLWQKTCTGELETSTLNNLSQLLPQYLEELFFAVNLVRHINQMEKQRNRSKSKTRIRAKAKCPYREECTVWPREGQLVEHERRSKKCAVEISLLTPEEVKQRREKWIKEIKEEKMRLYNARRNNIDKAIEGEIPEKLNGEAIPKVPKRIRPKRQCDCGGCWTAGQWLKHAVTNIHLNMEREMMVQEDTLGKYVDIEFSSPPYIQKFRLFPEEVPYCGEDPSKKYKIEVLNNKQSRDFDNESDDDNVMACIWQQDQDISRVFGNKSLVESVIGENSKLDIPFKEADKIKRKRKCFVKKYRRRFRFDGDVVNAHGRAMSFVLLMHSFVRQKERWKYEKSEEVAQGKPLAEIDKSRWYKQYRGIAKVRDQSNPSGWREIFFYSRSPEGIPHPLPPNKSAILFVANVRLCTRHNRKMYDYLAANDKTTWAVYDLNGNEIERHGNCEKGFEGSEYQFEKIRDLGETLKKLPEYLNEIKTINASRGLVSAATLAYNLFMKGNMSLEDVTKNLQELKAKSEKAMVFQLSTNTLILTINEIIFTHVYMQTYSLIIIIRDQNIQINVQQDKIDLKFFDKNREISKQMYNRQVIKDFSLQTEQMYSRIIIAGWHIQINVQDLTQCNNGLE
eukprot:TRINITY_DN2650_c0_g2_i1.p1 TRINITY_DN2650_c0_g2~~TRINITY_DN2650_c0_g2_i1.p1  ORF type:complete len:760 (+),score=17.11 TRINITY_DN2650_c0_g2_i1:426-2705(+)